MKIDEKIIEFCIFFLIIPFPFFLASTGSFISGMIVSSYKSFLIAFFSSLILFLLIKYCN